MFPLILLQAKAGGETTDVLSKPLSLVFPLILLQAKAGGFGVDFLNPDLKEVSINSPSGEGGGEKIMKVGVNDVLTGFH